MYCILGRHPEKKKDLLTAKMEGQNQKTQLPPRRCHEPQSSKTTLRFSPRRERKGTPGAPKKKEGGGSLKDPGLLGERKAWLL